MLSDVCTKIIDVFIDVTRRSDKMLITCHIWEWALVLFLRFTYLAIVLPVIGEEAKDLFSSTDDMKMLFEQDGHLIGR